MEIKQPFRYGLNLDGIGAVLSFACAVHCLVLPIALILLPFSMSFLYGQKTELLFISGSLLLATLSFCLGYHVHRKIRLLMILYLCTGMIVVGKLWISGPMSLCLAASGALGLAAGHLLNHRFCKNCAECRHFQTYDP